MKPAPKKLNLPKRLRKSKAKTESTKESALKRIIGVGMFDSGIPDLATNKKYMEGFGEKSLGRRTVPPTEKS